MKTRLNLLAFDMGASNGRGILGQFDGERLQVEELHRFENRIQHMEGMQYWDCLMIHSQMKHAFHTFQKRGDGPLAAFGIDTWGVDFGLLDRNGKLLGNPRAYRHATEREQEAVCRQVPYETLFRRTGIANLEFNTLYQLYRRKMVQDVALEQAQTLLLMPDLLGYFFTGEKASEYTNVTTTMLYNLQTRDWDWELLEKLGLPKHVFTKIDRAGCLRGKVLPEISEETGVRDAVFAAVGSHDTASAVAAIPGLERAAFCSSGTWSLFGLEREEPILAPEARMANFSNEGTVQGAFRPLRNIMGLWLLQECVREWKLQGHCYGWQELMEAAQLEKPFRSIVDPDEPRFFQSGNMEAKICDFCRETQQPVPETPGQVARCIYESLALKYKWVMAQLESLAGEPLEALHVVGGGCRNTMLNQMTADALGKPVIAGPVESAAIGNLLMQAMALGELRNMQELRQVVQQSETLIYYQPHNTQGWEDAYGRLLTMMGNARGN